MWDGGPTLRGMLSASCTYGLRAMAFLASRDPGNYVPIREISERLQISFHFLSKILHRLAAEGLVETYRGPNGGARLSRAPRAISVHDIVVAIDGPGLFKDCVLGLPGCGEAAPCPMHAAWAGQRAELEASFQSQHLEQMASGYVDLGERL